MKSYLYSSPSAQPFTGNDDYGSPRVPAGRRPTINYNRRSTPDGQYTNENYSNIPFSPPQPLPMNTASVNMGFDQPVSMPLEQAMRMRNQGNIARGPSPQFAASPMGQQRFPGMAPMTSGPASPAGPAPYSGNVGAMGGFGAQPAQPQSTQLTPEQKKMLKGYRDRLHAEVKAMKNGGIGDDGLPIPDAKAKLDDIAKYDEQLNPRPAFLDPKPAPAMQSQNIGPAPAMPYTNPQTGAPQMNAPIAPPTALPMSGPEYDKRVGQMYGTAGTDLDKNPGLGTTAPQHTPIPSVTVPPGGMGNSPADYRQASGQAYRNQGAIARMNEAGDNRVNGASQAQIEQNRQASINIGRKGAQLDAARGAANPPAQAAATTQPGQNLNDQQIAAYLQLAGGDVNKAKELARAHGHTVQ